VSGSAGIVIVGGGQAGFQLASALRVDGFDGAIRLVCDEPGLSYQRPPLSKAFLNGDVSIRDISFAAEDFYRDNAIDIIADRAAAIDPVRRTVRLASGGQLRHDRLVLATGARNRRMTGSEDIAGVLSLRTVSDAMELRDQLRAAGNIVIIGGGFLGLEVASACANLGVFVRVVEAMPRLMTRSVSETVARVFQQRLEARGVRFDLGVSRLGLRVNGRRVVGVEMDGRLLATSLVLACIGVIANAELAAEAGLPTGNGILTDGHLRTTAPAIYAIGDWAAHPNPYFGATVRLESVQNAVDQANCVASGIVGVARRYLSLPWFWSEQAGMKLQIAGDTSSAAQARVVHGDSDAGAFSVFHFRDRVLIGVESVNRPKDHMLARKTLRSGRKISPEALPELLEPQVTPA
jgi:3-phenylpropionate/trans-cinnamate dioxygenase ferredoxin reductase subunit